MPTLDARYTTSRTTETFDEANTYWRYGRFSDFSASATVADPDASLWTDDRIVGRLTTLHGCRLIKGDSGGPWWTGHVAVGTTVGCIKPPTGPPYYEVFAKAAWMPTILNVRVMRAF